MARHQSTTIPLVLCGIALAGCAGTTPAPSPAVAVPTSEPIVLETGSGQLRGTLTRPGADGKVPVALIIAGSGPTDRDGNIGGVPGRNDSYRMLAEGLAGHGIASVRYDKRGIAASAAAGPSESDLRFETFVEDAEQWLRTLRRDERFSKVVVVGHSEGSSIGMIAAREAGADAFVSIAGPARRASEILREQLRPALPPQLLGRSEEILQALEREDTVAEVPDPLAALYRPSVQPYLISWFRYTPAEEIARLNVPVLIVQGTTDVQVSVAEAEQLAAGRPGADLEIVEGMNHVLKRVAGGAAEQQSSYFDPALPIVPEMVRSVAEFIRGL